MAGSPRDTGGGDPVEALTRRRFLPVLGFACGGAPPPRIARRAQGAERGACRGRRDLRISDEKKPVTAALPGGEGAV